MADDQSETVSAATRQTHADQAVLAYVTCPDATVADDIARALVASRDAACVNVIPGMRSVYRWQGKIEMDSEHLLLVKTRRHCLEAIQTALDRLHPDELPELITVEIDGGSRAYIDWLHAETR